MARLNSSATGWLDVPRSLFGTKLDIGFVVISGFLVKSSVESMIKHGGGVVHYIKARATRIAPLYYLGPTMFCLEARPMSWLPSGWETVIGQAFLVQNVLIGFGTFGALVATLTVAFEVWR